MGKSEVCGLAGNTLQAFGPELVKKGFVVLAPDSICFEDRRKDPTVEGFDFWQHFDEMCYRILKGEYLMKKVLEDAMNGVSLLSQLEYVDSKRIGTLGHSYGGNTVMFLAAPDIVEKVSPTYINYDALDHLQHKRYQGSHALTEERFRDIIEWVDNRGNKLLREESL